MSEGEWFAPKRFGYGAGLPIRWQGWVVLLAYAAVTIGAAVALARRQPWAGSVVLVAATIVLAVFAARHTRGGWRWRWGEGD